MNSEIKYRQITSSKALQIATYLTNDYFDCGNFDDYWSESEIEGWLSNNNDFCVGAFLDDLIVGFCLTHYHREANKVHLENIYVIEGLRCKGIAGKMIDELIAHYNKRCKRMRYIGLVNVNNESTIKLLTNKGFRIGDNMFWIQKNCEKNSAE